MGVWKLTYTEIIFKQHLSVATTGGQDTIFSSNSSTEPACGRGSLQRWYSWRDPLGRFGMTQFVDVGPETTIWTFDPLCWSTNLLLCRKNPNVHFVVSPILSDTICWFGSNNESTICTIDQFCWCGWLFLKSTFLMVDKFCWFVVDTESTIFVNWPDLTKSTDRLTFTQNNLLDG